MEVYHYITLKSDRLISVMLRESNLKFQGNPDSTQRAVKIVAQKTSLWLAVMGEKYVIETLKNLVCTHRKRASVGYKFRIKIWRYKRVTLMAIDCTLPNVLTVNGFYVDFRTR